MASRHPGKANSRVSKLVLKEGVLHVLMVTVPPLPLVLLPALRYCVALAGRLSCS